MSTRLESGTRKRFLTSKQLCRANPARPHLTSKKESMTIPTQIQTRPTARIAALGVSVLLAGTLFTTIPAAAAPGWSPLPGAEPATTGWAASNGGTNGGADAPDESIYVVSDRSELLSALDNHGAPDAPKIIYVDGTIHGNEAANGELLEAEDYAPGYDIQKYLSCFGADGWSDAVHDYCGSQRRLRQTGSNNLKRQIEIKIPSNTTLLGVGENAGFTSTNIMLHVDTNIVIRNLTFEAPVDHFTSWDPNDGEEGSWNARFDAMSSVTASNIWVDHVTFTDGRYPDSSASPGPNGKPINFHDGLFDMKDGTDFVSVTNSRFETHDKTMLLGSGDDNADTDAGKLRITIAHNHFDGTGQRSPRVRYGAVHVLNNYYSGKVNDPVSPLRSSANGGHSYFIGLGYESRIVSEGNAFDYVGPGADESIILANWNATRFLDSGSWFKGQPIDVNVLAADGYERTASEARAAAASEGEEPPAWALAGFTSDVGWDPSAEYPYVAEDSYAAVKWHGKHATGAGVIDIAAP